MEVLRDEELESGQLRRGDEGDCRIFCTFDSLLYSQYRNWVPLIWLIVKLFGDNRYFVTIVIVVGAVFWFLWVRTLIRLVNLWLERC